MSDYKGYIYLVKCNKYVKVGKTKKSIKERLLSLQTGCPYELTLIDFFQSYDPTKDELVIHEKLANFHVKGEWFCVPEEVIAKRSTWFKPHASKQENNNNDKSKIILANIFINNLNIATEIIRRSKNEIAVTQHIQEAIEHLNYLESYYEIHKQLQLHDCLNDHSREYDDKIKSIIRFQDKEIHQITRREKLKITMMQIAGSLTLENDETSKGWEAVNTAVNAGKLSIAPFK